MKHYTLEQATEIAEKEDKVIVLDQDMKFMRGIYNLTRVLFGKQPKRYYVRDYEKGDEWDLCRLDEYLYHTPR